jgi:hypothetical protein
VLINEGCERELRFARLTGLAVAGLHTRLPDLQAVIQRVLAKKRSPGMRSVAKLMSKGHIFIGRAYKGTGLLF